MRSVELNVGKPRCSSVASGTHPSLGTRRAAAGEALLLCIKAKLDAVECGITKFEAEFMAQIVDPSGRTVGEIILPQIPQRYQGVDHRLTLPGLPAPEQAAE